MVGKAVNIRVVVRFRPENEMERTSHVRGETLRINYMNLDRTVELKTPQRTRLFNFDRVFRPETTQDDFYTITCGPVLDDVLSGYNGTIFAYGQTGSGKTWCMMGPTDEELKHEDEYQGIIPRAANAIFNHINTSKERNVEYRVSVSYLEIYNDEVRCLLDPSRSHLTIHESPSRGIFVKGLSEEYVTRVDGIFAAIELGDHHKMMAETGMNKLSSRSHSVLTIKIQKTELMSGKTTSGRLNLVDLAGSEKVRKTGASGQRMVEAKNINASLSALGLCINSIVEHRPYIPYRNSKLTRMLQDSLHGNFKTTIVCTCSPHPFNLEETISTLGFGKRAKSIKLRVKRNVVLSAEELMKMVDSLERQLRSWKLKNKGLLGELAGFRNLSEEEQRELGKLTKASTLEGYIDDVDDDEEEEEGESGSGPSKKEDSLENMTMTELQFEMRTLRCKYDNEVVSVQEDIQREATKRMEAQSAIDDLKKNISKLRADIKVLKEAQARFGESKLEIERSCDTRIAAFDQQKAECIQNNSQLLVQIERLERTVDGFSEELDGVVGSSIEDASTRAQFQSEIESFRRASADLKEENVVGRDRVAELQHQSDAARKELETLQQQAAQSKAIEKQLLEENTLLQSQFAMLDSDLVETERDLEAMMDDNERFENLNSDLLQQHSGLTDTLRKKGVVVRKMKLLTDSHGLDIRELRAFAIPGVMMDSPLTNDAPVARLPLASLPDESRPTSVDPSAPSDAVVEGGQQPEPETQPSIQYDLSGGTDDLETAALEAFAHAPCDMQLRRRIALRRVEKGLNPVSVADAFVSGERERALTEGESLDLFFAPHVNDAFVDTLEGEGYSRGLAVRALMLTRNVGLEKAREWLRLNFENEDPAVLDPAKIGTIRHERVSGSLATRAVEGCVSEDLVQELMKDGYSREAALRALVFTHNAGLSEARDWLALHRNDPDLNDAMAVSVKTVRVKVGGDIGLEIAERHTNPDFVQELVQEQRVPRLHAVKGLIRTRNVSVKAAQGWVNDSRPSGLLDEPLEASATTTFVTSSNVDGTSSLRHVSTHVSFAGGDAVSTGTMITFGDRTRSVSTSKLSDATVFSTIGPLRARSDRVFDFEDEGELANQVARIETKIVNLSDEETESYRALVASLKRSVTEKSREAAAARKLVDVGRRDRDRAIREMQRLCSEREKDLHVSEEKVKLLSIRSTLLRKNLVDAQKKFDHRMRELETEKTDLIAEKAKYLKNVARLNLPESGGAKPFSSSPADLSKPAAFRRRGTFFDIRPIVNELTEIRRKYATVAKKQKGLVGEANHQRRQLLSDRHKLAVARDTVAMQLERIRKLDSSLTVVRGEVTRQETLRARFRQEREMMSAKIADLERKLRATRSASPSMSRLARLRSRPRSNSRVMPGGMAAPTARSIRPGSLRSWRSPQDS